MEYKKVKKGTVKKKIKRKENFNRDFRKEVIGIVLFLVGILFWLSFHFQGSVGAFGNLIHSVSFGFLGFPAFFISYFIMYFSVMMIKGRTFDSLRPKLSSAVVFLVIVSSIIHAGHAGVDFEADSFFGTIRNFYNLGGQLSGGGFIGGVISTPLVRVFQTLGTIIILVTLGIIDLMVLTDISFIGILERLVDFSRDVVRNLGEKFKNLIHSFKKNKEIKASSNVISVDFENKEDDVSEEMEANSSEVYDEELGNTTNETIEDEIINDVQSTQEVNPKMEKNSSKDVNDESKHIVSEIESEKSENMRYVFPNKKQLAKPSSVTKDYDKKNAASNKTKLEQTLASFGVEAKVINVTQGPAVTRYELAPAPGVKVSKIVGLADDISLNLATSGIRIEAPIPGKAAIGIEVPNKNTKPVLLSDVILSDEFSKFKPKLAFALGKDISGNKVLADISKMPHLLVAGATGAGKSVCINSLIVSILYKASPEEVKLLMIDPKVVELGIYNGIPHLLIPVVTDPKKAAGALNWAVLEMTQRYKSFADNGVRDVNGYNNLMIKTGGETLPQIVIIIDELADLMMVAPGDVEDAICRLAQMARAAGMHLVIATQRPSVDVITGIIKANIPSRIAFAVTSQVDSRTILDMAGAEKLLGKGDMLFHPVGESKPKRVKGSFVTEKEVENVVEFVKNQKQADYSQEVVEQIKTIPVGKSKSKNKAEGEQSEQDELLDQVIELIVTTNQVSASLIQRKFKVGYARAGRIIDQLEQKNIIGEFEPGKPRKVLMTKHDFSQMQMASKS